MAPHLMRLTAFGVDVLGATAVPLALIVIGTINVPDLLVPWPVVAVVVVVACLAGTSGLSVWLTGGLTMGKALTGLTVRRADAQAPDSSLKGLRWSIARNSIGYVMIDVFGIGALTSFITPRRRCLHDVVFGSEVVYLPPEPDAAVSIEARGKAFSAQLQAGLERSKEHYGWLSFLWRWWVKVILVITGVVFFLCKGAGIALAGQVTTPAVSATPAPAALGPAAVTAIVIPTTAVTGLLVAGSVPDDGRAYSGLSVTAAISVEEPDETAVDPASGILYAAAGDRIVAIDTSTHEVIDTIATDVGDELALDPATGTVYGLGPEGVAVIDTSSHEVIDTVEVDVSIPTDLVLNPAAGELYVLGWWSGPAVVDTSTGDVIHTVDIYSSIPSLTTSNTNVSMAFDPLTDSLYVIVTRLGVAVIDTATREVIDTIAGVSPSGDGVASDPTAGTVYVASTHDGVEVIDTATREVIDSIAVASRTFRPADGVAVDAETGTVYVADTSSDSVSVIDTVTHDVIDTVAVSRPTSVTVHPATGILYVSSFDDDAIYILEPR